MSEKFFEQTQKSLIFCWTIQQLLKLLLEITMVELTFNGLFMTTSKGIPDMTNIPSSTTLSKSTFVYSVIIQVVILLIFLLYFALSIFRVVKKIKNNNFQEILDDEKREELNEKNNKNQTQHQGEDENQNEKQDKLVYRFDDDDEEEQEEKKEEGKQESGGQGKQNQKEQQAKQENYDDYHDENEESFINLDSKLLFLQPFLIPFIICNNSFTVDPFTIILTILTLVSYLVFNIKRKCENVKVLQFLFIIFSILGYLSFFYNDHDLTT